MAQPQPGFPRSKKSATGHNRAKDQGYPSEALVPSGAMVQVQRRRMNQKDWNNRQNKLVSNAYIDLLRKRIFQEDYDRIRKQTYHDYLDDLGLIRANEWRDHTGQLRRERVRYY